MAVKPYIGALKAPTEPPSSNPKAPECTVEIEHVFGYNGCGASYGAGGQVLYSVAALGLQMKRSEADDAWEQKYCIGHGDDIQSFAMSADRSFFATGEMGKSPVVKVWDTESCLLLATLR